MKQPTVQDSGREVVLDLHGATIREAVMLVRRTLQESVLRGRQSVKVIHGYSTSVNPRKPTSIREELYALLDEGSLTDVQSQFRSDGYMILFLGHFSAQDHRRIAMRDILFGV